MFYVNYAIVENKSGIRKQVPIVQARELERKGFLKIIEECHMKRDGDNLDKLNVRELSELLLEGGQSIPFKPRKDELVEMVREMRDSQRMRSIVAEAKRQEQEEKAGIAGEVARSIEKTKKSVIDKLKGN